MTLPTVSAIRTCTGWRNVTWRGWGRTLWRQWPNLLPARFWMTYPVESVRVRVVKVRPPIKGGVLSGAGVEVFRQRAK